MRHDKERQKIETALTILLFGPLYEETERLRHLGIEVNPIGARTWALERARPIVTRTYQVVSRATVGEKVDQDKSLAAAQVALLPLLSRTIADDAMSAVMSGRTLRINNARNAAITNSTRVITLSELFSLGFFLNGGASPLGGPDAHFVPNDVGAGSGATKLPLIPADRLLPAGENPPLLAPIPGVFVNPLERAIWRIDPRSNVCPICLDLDNEPYDRWFLKYPLGPPAHPHCACSLDYRA